jgi:hypothetical protein
MNDDENDFLPDPDDELDPIDPHVIEFDKLLSEYELAPIDSWAAADLVRLVELIDTELQLRAPPERDTYGN